MQRAAFFGEMDPARRQFHEQNAAKCREEASRSTAESEKRAWIRMAEQWERLASGSGRWDDAGKGAKFLDQEESGASRREPQAT